MIVLVNVALDELRIVRAHPFYMEGFLIVFHSIDERGLHLSPIHFIHVIASLSPFISLLCCGFFVLIFNRLGR